MIRLPKEVIKFLESHGTIYSHPNGTKVLYLPNLYMTDKNLEEIGMYNEIYPMESAEKSMGATAEWALKKPKS